MNSPGDTEAAVIAELRAELARQAVTISALAQGVGMTADQVSRRLAGKTPITLPELLNFADALSVSLETLVRRAAVAA